MKKFSILLFGALALSFAACEEGPSVPPMQENPQGPVYESNIVAVEMVGPIASGKFNYDEYVQEAEEQNAEAAPAPTIEVAKVASVEAPFEVSQVSFDLQISNTPDFENTKTLALSIENGVGSVAVDKLNEAHVALFGLTPDDDEVYYRIPVYVTDNGVTYRIGGINHFAISGSYLDVTTMKRPAYLCTPGGANLWSQASSQWLAYSDGKQYFCGAVLEAGSFKLTDGDSWADDKTWGMGKEEGTLDQPGGNIPVAADGLHWVTADLSKLTYTNVPITSVGVIGGFTDWKAESPIELTANSDQSVWSADVDLTGDWKIIINHSWDSNYGGAADNLVFDAGNIGGYEGTYTVTMDFSGNYPKLTLTAK